MGILVAIVVAAGAAFGLSKKDGVLDKGYDTTYKDTVAFEYQAARTAEEFQHAKAIRLENRMETWDVPSDASVEASDESTQEPGI